MKRSSLKPLIPKDPVISKIKELLNLPEAEDVLESEMAKASALMMNGQVDKGLQYYLDALDLYCKKVGDWAEPKKTKND